MGLTLGPIFDLFGVNDLFPKAPKVSSSNYSLLDHANEIYNKNTGLVANSAYKTGGSLGNVSYSEGLQNEITGNLDFQRQIELQSMNNQFNAVQAQKQRDFEEYMSNTAYQRQREDLIKSGLNPYLLYGSGGASTPNGSSAMASGHTYHPRNSNLLNGITGTFLNFLMNTSLNAQRNSYLEHLEDLKHAHLIERNNLNKIKPQKVSFPEWYDDYVKDLDRRIKENENKKVRPMSDKEFYDFWNGVK